MTEASQITFFQWKDAVFELIPGRMVFENELRPMFKDGLSPVQAVELAQSKKLVHVREHRPMPAVSKAGRPRTVGVKRKPFWSVAQFEAKMKTALFAVIAEAELHSMNPDGIERVRAVKEWLFKGESK